MHLSYDRLGAPAISALSRAAASAAPAASCQCARGYNELLSDSKDVPRDLGARVVRVSIVTRLGVTSSDSKGPTTQAAVVTVPHSARATATEWPTPATSRHLWMNRVVCQ
jgi:hypothetical protein